MFIKILKCQQNFVAAKMLQSWIIMYWLEIILLNGTQNVTFCPFEYNRFNNTPITSWFVQMFSKFYCNWFANAKMKAIICAMRIMVHFVIQIKTTMGFRSLNTNQIALSTWGSHISHTAVCLSANQAGPLIN